MLKNLNTKWFKFDRDWLCVNKPQSVPVIFEPPCTCRRIWLFIQLLQKLATASPHALPTYFIQKNIYVYISKDAVGPLVTVLTLPCFCHNKFMQHGLPKMPCSIPLHTILDKGSLCLENDHFKFKIHVFCSFPQPLYANVGIVPWLDLVTSFQVFSNSSSVTVTLNAIQPELLTAMYIKPQNRQYVKFHSYQKGSHNKIVHKHWSKLRIYQLVVLIFYCQFLHDVTERNKLVHLNVWMVMAASHMEWGLPQHWLVWWTCIIILWIHRTALLKLKAVCLTYRVCHDLWTLMQGVIS